MTVSETSTSPPPKSNTVAKKVSPLFAHRNYLFIVYYRSGEEGRDRGEGGMSKNEPGRKVTDQNKLVSLDTFANSRLKERHKWIVVDCYLEDR